MKRTARAAFQARKPNVPELVKAQLSGERESEGYVDEEDRISVDGLSDEEVEFTNAFDALTNITESAIPTPKRQKQKRSVTKNEKLSTCDPKRISKMDNDSLKVTLLPDEVITVCGNFFLTVVEGCISILGAKLKATKHLESYSVCAPLSQSLPVITLLQQKKTKRPHATIQIKSWKSGIEKFHNICPFAEPLFAPPPSSSSVSPEDTTFHIVLQSPTPIARTSYPLSWIEALNAISSSSSAKVLICGPKGAGKSTLSQYLVNSLVHRQSVNYLEMDPGRPSSSPPGLVSLYSFSQPIFSPAFVCSGMANILRSHHIGNVSPRDNPRYYLDCISELVSHIPHDVPTIINTPGWTKGTGFELLASQIEILRPQYVIVLSRVSDDSLTKTLHPIASGCGSHLLVVDSTNVVPPSVALTAADLRPLSIMNYFHQVGFEKWDFKTHLTSWKPWVVKFSGTDEERGIFGVAIQGEELLLEDILCAINGTMVAIIIVTSNANIGVSFTQEGIPILNGRKSLFMDPKVTRCVGYAVIRGINSENGLMMLLTPWDPTGLADGECVILERGRVNLPVWGMWDYKKPVALGPWLLRQ